jgi:hypothetical protein
VDSDSRVAALTAQYDQQVAALAAELAASQRARTELETALADLRRSSPSAAAASSGASSSESSTALPSSSSSSPSSSSTAAALSATMAGAGTLGADEKDRVHAAELELARLQAAKDAEVRGSDDTVNNDS